MSNVLGSGARMMLEILKD